MSALTNLDQIVSCITGYDPEALPVDKALEVIDGLCAPVLQDLATERVAVRDALGRVLAQDLVSPIDVPSHDNAAMDGFAFDGGLLAGAAEQVRLTVAGEAFAGRLFEQACPPGSCIRIMTGAVMPAGCDTVIPQEFTERQGEQVVFLSRAVRQGDNRRLAGEDLTKGKAALQAGRLIRPADLGLAASLGYAELSVRRRLRVAFFSTGDELRSVGEVLEPGCVYDSNRYTIFGMLSRLGVDVVDMGVIPDQPQALEQAFRQAAASADAIVTSGGVSVGEADFIKAMMAKLGDVTFWRIAMRPGRPMAFGRIWSGERVGQGDSAVLFGLPGNPVAVMVTFYIFVRHGLLTMMGAPKEQSMPMSAISDERIPKKPGRTEYRRGQLFVGADGRTFVRTTGGQGSGILRSMSDANCLVVLGHQTSVIEKGEPVVVLPFDSLV
ncbi:MAG: gephyrin-like molybdotransferase Glp [Burkholderiaceae bacterium]